MISSEEGGQPAVVLENEIVPQHIAVIMDGNGRWAKARGLPRVAGHKAAVSRVRELVDACVDLKIPVLTLYAFSSENWARPKEEVGVLMGLYIHYLRSEVKRWHRRGVRLRVIGDLAGLSEELQSVTAEAQQLTAENTQLQLNVAINYGGRAELVRAIRKIGADVQRGVLQPAAIQERDVEQALYTHDQPMPDLMIRTSGVSRISNFLLWQLAYAELYFTSVFFPDFDRKHFNLALQWFAQQPRRFGKIDEQLRK